MSKLVSVEEMIAVEEAANAAGLSYAEMMNRAGMAIAEIANSEFDELASAFAIVGKGKNGGDALIALKILREYGWYCVALLSESRNDNLVKDLEEVGGLIHVWDNVNRNATSDLINDSVLFLDGLLGTGFKLPLREKEKKILATLGALLEDSSAKPKIIAVDCPSGMDCQTGDMADEVISADITVSLAAVKEGMLTFPANETLGQLVVADIGIPAELKEWGVNDRNVMDQALVSEWLPQRKANSHKGDYGKVLIVAGSEKYPGAALLAAKGAARSGAGLITLLNHSGLDRKIAGKLPEATWTTPRELRFGQPSLEETLGKYQAMLIGPGLTLKSWNRLIIEDLLAPNKSRALVLDAYVLRYLANNSQKFNNLPKNSVLTPHPGEFSAMTGITKDDILANRNEIAATFAKKWGHVIVLKGALTVIAGPNDRLAVVPIASPALASAGTGDVLAGIIVGLLAQGLDPFKAASIGAWVHAQSALLASEHYNSNRGILASDLLDYLPELLM
jgi:NAD(P)H-hydrate epimerase